MGHQLFTHKVSTVLTREARQELDGLVERAGVSKCALIRAAVTDFLAEHGDASGEELLALKSHSDGVAMIKSRLPGYEIVKKKEVEETVEAKP